jgi:hypothetical protein
MYAFLDLTLLDYPHYLLAVLITAGHIVVLLIIQIKYPSEIKENN